MPMPSPSPQMTTYGKDDLSVHSLSLLVTQLNSDESRKWWSSMRFQRLLFSRYLKPLHYRVYFARMFCSSPSRIENLIFYASVYVPLIDTSICTRQWHHLRPIIILDFSNCALIFRGHIPKAGHTAQINGIIQICNIFMTKKYTRTQATNHLNTETIL